MLFNLRYVQVDKATTTLDTLTSYTLLGSNFELQRSLRAGRFYLELGWSWSPGGWGTWGDTFGSFHTTASFNAAAAGAGFQLRGFLGADYGAVPEGEKLRLAGIGLRERHFRHWESFWDELSASSLGSHAFRQGGGGLRGFAAQDSSVGQIFALNLMVDRRLPVPRFLRPLSLGFFTDLAYLPESGDQPADAGLELTWKPYWKRTNFFTAWLRPFELTLGVPLVRKSALGWEAPSLGRSWYFTINWRDY